ncbi:hypothetical protein PHBOTO_004296 [Pseudozyma hubeiensis]|nr:hypothetical protein PHBOTO_004296 [Pseudozyma hubeiensis]
MLKLLVLIGVIAVSFATCGPINSPDGQASADFVPKDPFSHNSSPPHHVFELQKRGSTFSSLWKGEHFEPTTSEPTPPFHPLLPLDSTLEYLSMGLHDPQAVEIIAFHRRYDKLIDTATLPPPLAVRLARKYEGYQRWFPLRGEDTRTMQDDAAVQLFRSDVMRNRFASMRDYLNLVMTHAVALRLDSFRVGYLEALLTRFESTADLLSPSEDSIRFSARFGDSRRPLRAQQYAQWELDKKAERIRQNLPRLRQDHDLLVKLETEFEDLVRKTTQAGPHHVRRNMESYAVSKYLYRTEPASSSVKLKKRNFFGPESRSAQQQQSWLTLEQAWEGLWMTGDDPGAHSIADFLRRHQELLPNINIDPHQRHSLMERYQQYQRTHPLRGSTVNYDEPRFLLREMTLASGRDRIRDIQPIINHMLQNQEPLQLAGARAAYLEAVRQRFGHTEADMTPTVDELIQLASTDEVLSRMTNWVHDNSEHEPLEIRERLRARMYQPIHSPLRFVQDLSLLQKVEKALDGYVARVGNAGRHLDRRDILESAIDTPDPCKQASTASKRQNSGKIGVLVPSQSEHSEHLGSRRVALLARAGDPSSSQRTFVPDQSFTEAMNGLPLELHETGALPIATYWSVQRQLFPPSARSHEALQELQSIYVPYQHAHPVRARAVNIRDDRTFASQLMEAVGRDRFRDIDKVLKHLIDNKDELGLDEVRIEYLKALKARFQYANRVLTPTPDEILDRGTERIQGLRDPRVATNDIKAILAKVSAYVRVRSRISEANAHRLAVDLGLLGHLEESLDQVVQGVNLRMMTGRRLLRRDIAQMSPKDAFERRRVVSFQVSNIQHSSTASSRTQPDSTTINRFLSRDRPLLSQSGFALDLSQQLVDLVRDYRDEFPIQGRDMNLQDGRWSLKLMLNDVGRDRFRKMEPILSRILVDREALHLDRSRVTFLEAAVARVRESQRLLSPTLDDLERAKRSALNEALSNQDTRDMLQSISKATAERSHRTMTQGARFLQDLQLIKYLETELSNIREPIEQTREAGSHLIKRNRSQALSGGQPPPTEADMTEILSPIGMNLHDEHARTIAAWRLHENSLLAGHMIPDDLRATLRSQWAAYRSKFRNRLSFTEGLLWPVRFYHLIYTDEGARFNQANDVIR